MITITGLATSNEQGMSAIKDLKNRNLIMEGFVSSSYGDKKIQNLSGDKDKLSKSFDKGKYLVVLQSNADVFPTIKELAEGLHGLDQISQI